MTAQAGDKLLYQGKEWTLIANPLEAYWQQHPPRPELRMQGSHCHRGYWATWEIVDDRLYLVDLEGIIKGEEEDLILEADLEAMIKGEEPSFEALNDRLERYMTVWRVPTNFGLTLGRCTVAEIVDAYERAPIAAPENVKTLLLATSKFLVEATKDVPREAVPDAREIDNVINEATFAAEAATSPKKRDSPLTVHSLFPQSEGPVFAEWATGWLHCPHGKLLEYVNAGYLSTYEFALIIEIRNGRVVKVENRRTRLTVKRKVSKLITEWRNRIRYFQWR